MVLFLCFHVEYSPNIHSSHQWLHALPRYLPRWKPLARAMASSSSNRNFSASFSSACFLSNHAALAFNSATLAFSCALPDVLEYFDEWFELRDRRDPIDDDRIEALDLTSSCSLILSSPPWSTSLFSTCILTLHTNVHYTKQSLERSLVQIISHATLRNQLEILSNTG